MSAPRPLWRVEAFDAHDQLVTATVVYAVTDDEARRQAREFWQSPAGGGYTPEQLIELRARLDAPAPTP